MAVWLQFVHGIGEFDMAVLLLSPLVILRQDMILIYGLGRARQD